MLEETPEDWRPLFACGPALGLRKGELFALRKSDVDLARGTLTVARSHERDTTKTGAAAVLPIPATLRPWLEHQLEHAPGPLLFPAPDGSLPPRRADPQKILRSALSRAPEPQALRKAANAPDATLAAFLLHLGQNEGSTTSGPRSQPSEHATKSVDGRSRDRTYDPCRVNSSRGDGSTRQVLSNLRNYWIQTQKQQA